MARFQLVAGTADFARRFAIELLVETARLWMSLGYFDADGEFRIDGVTGPDEYSAIADNNVYTNLMAKRNLLAAVAVLQGSDADRSDWPTWTTTSWRPGSAPPTTCGCPTTSGWTCTRRPTTSPATRSGTSTAPRRTSTRCC